MVNDSVAAAAVVDGSRVPVLLTRSIPHWGGHVPLCTRRKRVESQNTEPG